MQPEPSTSTLLTMEQQFALRKYQAMIKEASKEELEALCLEVIRQKMAQENIFKDLMREAKPF